MREPRLSGFLSRDEEMKSVWGHTFPWACGGVRNGFWKKWAFVRFCFMSELLLWAVAGGAVSHPHSEGDLGGLPLRTALSRAAFRGPSPPPLPSPPASIPSEERIRCSEPTSLSYLKQNHSPWAPYTEGSKRDRANAVMVCRILFLNGFLPPGQTSFWPEGLWTSVTSRRGEVHCLPR